MSTRTILWQIGKPFQPRSQAKHAAHKGSAEFRDVPENVPVFNYKVDKDPNAATKPDCPGVLYKNGHPRPPDRLKRNGTATAKLNIHFDLATDYAPGELKLVYGRFGSDVDHVHFDGDRLAVVEGRGEGKWMRFKHVFGAVSKGPHVLTLTTHGGIGNSHAIDFLRLVANSDAAVEPADVEISFINFDGAERRTEGDEYVEITNAGGQDADISGWHLHADDLGQDFHFPQGTKLAAGQSIRVYTNLDDPNTGGFNWGSGRAIWNNQGDLGALLDANEDLVSTYGYGDKAPPQP
ncbi:lamin tail domain-containing protein [Haliangium sp.]|uniref:lamin tail domain-containing protein n=1 Tax=Haliangium sp. TaxID=2663208 RepID=UPI003D0E4DFB